MLVLQGGNRPKTPIPLERIRKVNVVQYSPGRTLLVMTPTLVVLAVIIASL